MVAVGLVLQGETWQGRWYGMVYHGLVERLVSEMEQMEIIDAHEHLPPESQITCKFERASAK